LIYLISGVCESAFVECYVDFHGMSVFGFEYPQPNRDYATELLISSKEVPENQNLYV
jgi:hypothetical protein